MAEQQAAGDGGSGPMRRSKRTVRPPTVYSDTEMTDGCLRTQQRRAKELKRRERQLAREASKVVTRPAPSPESLPPKTRRLVRKFLDTGMCDIESGFTKEQVRLCRHAVYDMFNETMETIQRLDLAETFLRTGFSRFKLRHHGRYDMQIEQFETPAFKFLRQDAPWLPLIGSILGPDFCLANAGVMLSMPGSVTQPWHSDGDHINRRTHLPPHALNLFLPLVNITPTNGGTELVPGTHIQGAYDLEDGNVTPLLRSGQCLLFDFRLKHRGLGNKSLRPRPVMYLTYALKSWKDTMNFSNRRYSKLPLLPARPNRAERSAKRGLDGASTEASDGASSASGPAAGGRYIVDYDSDVDTTPEQRKPPPTEAERVHAARAKHRALSVAAPRVNGMCIYVGAPVLAQDHDQWYPATIARVKGPDDGAAGKAVWNLTIHFSGWSKRHDFCCDSNSSRIKRAPSDIVARCAKTAAGPVQKSKVPGQFVVSQVKRARVARR
eukprot:m.67550 g.67550  ORF g.67550 m.67550 type:complete len:493 (-) comp13835_c0_seq2:627-2105(-)